MKKFMQAANTSGKELETFFKDILETKYNINTDPNIDNYYIQNFKINGIYGQERVDFFVKYQQRTFIFELKNQKVKGSVDQKFPFYLENIRKHKYKDSHFVFIVNTAGLRQGCLDYLKKEFDNLNFSLICTKNLNYLGEILNGTKLFQIETENDTVPVLKWVGSKRSLQKEILKHFPNDFRDYYEPFAGSLAVATKLGPCKKYIGDINESLINFYMTLKTEPNKLIEEIKTEKYHSNNLDSYNELRVSFNKSSKDSIKNAALFYFLNKTGYNGVYRENSKGEYNVPYGKRNFSLNEPHLLKFSEFLQDIEITHNNYSKTLMGASVGDLVYLDPPYLETFSNYTKETFGIQEHVKLYEKILELQKRGCIVILSNSDTTTTRTIYKNYDELIQLKTRRFVGPKESRTEITELLLIWRSNKSE